MKHLFLCLFMISLSACVTTRAELNEKRAQQGASSGSGEEEHSNVQSENIEEEPAVVKTNPHAPDPVEPSNIAGQYGLEEMRAEMAKLSGKVEEMEQEKKLQKETQSEEQKKMQAKIDDLEKQLKEKEDGPALPAGKTPLQAAKDAFFAQQYEDAIHFFDVYLKENESGKSAEEASYLRGESYFKLKQFKKAIVDYSKFPEKFSKSNFHPKALLRIGESFEALGNKEDARAFYSDLLDKFPKTVEGKLAKKKLASGKR